MGLENLVNRANDYIWVKHGQFQKKKEKLIIEYLRLKWKWLLQYLQWGCCGW